MSQSHIRNTIILVDDNPTNLSVGRTMLNTFYQVVPVLSADSMFEALEKITPELILLDIEMPDMDSYEAIRILKADNRYKDIPVMFITAKTDPESEVEGLDLGAVDYITKPFFAPMLLKRIEKELKIVKREKDFIKIQTELKHNLENMDALIHEKADTVIRLQNAVFDTVVDMVEFRDKYTGGHIVRTQKYVSAMITEMARSEIYTEELSRWDIASILASAKLHDVGKIAVSDVILGKNDKLTTDEFENMKSHVAASVDAIERIIKKTGEDDFFDHAMKMAGTHHEKWDGSGYPIGLKGHNIPLEGRIMAIADVYDALISKRQYKEAMSHAQACKIIEEGAGAQFDPTLIDVFRNIEDEINTIAENNAM